MFLPNNNVFFSLLEIFSSKIYYIMVSFLLVVIISIQYIKIIHQQTPEAHHLHEGHTYHPERWFGNYQTPPLSELTFCLWKKCLSGFFTMITLDHRVSHNLTLSNRINTHKYLFSLKQYHNYTSFTHKAIPVASVPPFENYLFLTEKKQILHNETIFRRDIKICYNKSNAHYFIDIILMK